MKLFIFPVSLTTYPFSRVAPTFARRACSSKDTASQTESWQLFAIIVTFLPNLELITDPEKKLAKIFIFWHFRKKEAIVLNVIQPTIQCQRDASWVLISHLFENTKDRLYGRCSMGSGFCWEKAGHRVSHWRLQMNPLSIPKHQMIHQQVFSDREGYLSGWNWPRRPVYLHILMYLVTHFIPNIMTRLGRLQGKILSALQTPRLLSLATEWLIKTSKKTCSLQAAI